VYCIVLYCTAVLHCILILINIIGLGKNGAGGSIYVFEFKIPRSRRLIGHLFYLMNTKSDLYFCIDKLTQFIYKLVKSHYTAATRILRYIKSSLIKGLLFPPHSF
jgi:hypothetical protein